MVGLTSVWATSGEVKAAAGGYLALLDYWQRAGNKTQLWTTARNAALFLLEHGRNRPAAAVLAAADHAESAATISGESALRMRQARARLATVISPADVAEVRRQTPAMTAADIIGCAREALRELSATDPGATRDVCR